MDSRLGAGRAIGATGDLAASRSGVGSGFDAGVGAGAGAGAGGGASLTRAFSDRLTVVSPSGSSSALPFSSF